MSYDLRSLRLTHSVHLDDMVTVIRENYPKMDKPLLSKCLNPNYGVQLQPDAVKAIGETFDPDGYAKRRSADRHLLPRSVRCRLTEEEFTAFSAAIRADGYACAQDWLRDHIQAYAGGESDDL